MRLWHCKWKIIRREKKPDDKEELVITVGKWKTTAEWWLSPAELFAFLWWWLPELIERLVGKIDDEDGWKYMKIMVLTFIKDKVDDLLSEFNNDSDDDD